MSQRQRQAKKKKQEVKFLSPEQHDELIKKGGILEDPYEELSGSTPFKEGGITWCCKECYEESLKPCECSIPPFCEQGNPCECCGELTETFLYNIQNGNSIPCCEECSAVIGINRKT